jgi:four helix bundle protein
MPTQRFEDVQIWQKAHAWVLSVYRFTAEFPRHELFGLTSQLRRAAVSIPANFVEGFKRSTRRDKARFYNIAQGSLEECRYYLILSRDLGYGETGDLQIALDGIGRMLAAYLRAVTTDEQ